MNFADIELIVDETISALKRTQKGWDDWSDKTKWPKYNDTYAETVELKKRMERHAVLGNKPFDLMDRRGPHEDDQQFRYREKNWNNITMPYFMKAMGKLNRIMNPSNYSIVWKKEQTDQKEYFDKEIPVFGSIIKFFEQIFLSQKIIDANALIICRPVSLPLREILVDEQQVFVIDDTQKITTAPYIFNSEYVVQFKECEYAMVEIAEKSKVRNGNKEERTGIIYEFYDTENIYRIIQTGVKREYTFEIELYYNHGLGYLPCERLKGIPVQIKDKFIFQSYFIYAVPHLDVALYSYSNLDIATVTQMFPQRVEYVERCDAQGCDNGYVSKYDDELRESTRHKCSVCNGTGRRGRVGPMMIKEHFAPDQITNPDNKIEFPGVTYVAPPDEPLKFVFDKFNDEVIAAFSFINFDVSNSSVKGTDTALGKQIDREELFAFLMAISNEIFDSLYFAIETCGKLRFGNDFEPPTISAPTSFAIRSEYDLTEELMEGKKAGLPDIALRQITREFVAKRFSNQEYIDPTVSLVFAVDRFITSNTIDITAKLANGTCLKWEAILHDSIYTYIDNALIEDSNFFNKSLEEQKKYLIGLAMAKADEISQQNTAIVKVEDIAA